MSASPRSSTRQSNALLLEQRQGFLSGPDRGRLDVAVADELDDRLALDVVVFDDKQVADLAVEEATDAGEGLVERFAVDRLRQVGHGAETHPAMRLVGHRDDVDRNMARRRVVLETVEHRPAVHAGQIDVERDGVRLIVPGHRQGRRRHEPPPGT